MRRFRIIAVAMIAVTMLAAACGSDETAEPTDSSPSAGASIGDVTTLTDGTLLVASCLDYPPFEYFEGSGDQRELKGFDVDLITAIAGEIGLEIEWKKANFDTIFTALQSNQFDAVAAASTITPERQVVVDFSDPYYASRQALTVNTEETPDITTTADLGDGDTVAVQKGTTGKIFAEENLVDQGVELKTFELAPDMFTDLEAGGVQGIINDEPASIAEVESRPSLEVIEPIDTNEDYGFAVSKDNPELLAAINAALASLIADGTYASIFGEYFPDVPVPEEFAAA